MMSDPLVQSKLAIALHEASNGTITIPAAMTRITGYANQLGNALNATSQANAGPTSR